MISQLVDIQLRKTDEKEMIHLKKMSKTQIF